MLRQKYQFKNYNWMLVIAVMVLCGLGVLFINSADSTYTSRQFLGTFGLHSRDVFPVCGQL